MYLLHQQLFTVLIWYSVELWSFYWALPQSTPNTWDAQQRSNEWVLSLLSVVSGEFSDRVYIFRKRWHLFPPEDTSKMYPTRIPYEESSVFSQVDVLRPDLKRFPGFETARAHSVTLQPGQVTTLIRHKSVTCSKCRKFDLVRWLKNWNSRECIKYWIK